MLLYYFSLPNVYVIYLRLIKYASSNNLYETPAKQFNVSMNVKFKSSKSNQEEKKSFLGLLYIHRNKITQVKIFRQAITQRGNYTVTEKP